MSGYEVGSVISMIPSPGPGVSRARLRPLRDGDYSSVTDSLQVPLIGYAVVVVQPYERGRQQRTEIQPVILWGEQVRTVHDMIVEGFEVLPLPPLGSIPDPGHP